jgi:hypothetical protein
MLNIESKNGNLQVVQTGMNDAWLQYSQHGDNYSVSSQGVCSAAHTRCTGWDQLSEEHCPNVHLQVLSIYPTTIRRRILRHLYLRHLRGSYLFRWGHYHGVVPQQSLDGIHAAAAADQAPVSCTQWHWHLG